MSKWTVYISSTFKDLRNYRADLITLFQNQLKDSFELSHIMERMFDDGSYTPFVEDCVKAVIASDIYIIILGNKTGSFPPNEERTYTEIELDTALNNEKRVFCLRLEQFNENEIDNKEKHDAILDKFLGRPIHRFNDSLSLRNALYEFLFQFASQPKGSKVIDKKIKDYVENEEFRQFLIELSGNNNIQNYFSLPPFILGNIISVLNVDDRNPNYDKYRTIGPGRYKLVREYFNTYFNLCKYSVLSILWDELKESGDMARYKQSVYDLINDSRNNKTHVETLQKLCDEILQKFGGKKEKLFIEQLMPSFPMFKTGIEAFKTIKQDAVTYWDAECILKDLMTFSKFLNNYEIRSIRSRYYIRHRNDDTVRYDTLHYAKRDENIQHSTDDFIVTKFVNNHSLYLCQKIKGGDIVINLSPFYFDRNAYDSNALKIKLFEFDHLTEHADVYSYNYVPLFNPTEHHGNTASNSKITIKTDKITTPFYDNKDELTDKEKVDKEKHKKELVALKKLNLFEQFNPFIDNLLQHESH